MKRLIAKWLIPVSFFISFSSCSKKVEVDNCAEIQKVSIVAVKNSVYLGDTIWLQTNLIPPISLFNWSRGDNSNRTWNDAEVFIYPCTKADEGWYYLNVSYPDCAFKNDSIYISVLNNPVTAPCSPANNQVSFSSLGNLIFNSTSYSLDPSFNCKLLAGNSSGNSPFNIYFNAFWNDKEPEDGAYDILNQLDFTGYAPYSVYINNINSSVLFEANPGKVYVTHENGKLKVSFCSITMTGSLGGPTFSTTATGTLIAP